MILIGLGCFGGDGDCRAGLGSSSDKEVFHNSKTRLKRQECFGSFGGSFLSSWLSGLTSPLGLVCCF